MQQANIEVKKEVDILLVILGVLISTNAHLNHLKKEHIAFDKFLENVEDVSDDDDDDIEQDENIFNTVVDLKMYLQFIYDKAWRCFEEVSY